MLSALDTECPKELSDSWKDYIKLRVRRMMSRLPEQITPELAFNGTTSSGCQRVQLIGGQLYIYLNRYYKIPRRYIYHHPNSHLIACVNVYV